MSNENKHVNAFNKNDTYGITRKEMEVDSDVNEDINREMLLDDSVNAFIEKNKNKFKP